MQTAPAVFGLFQVTLIDQRLDGTVYRALGLNAQRRHQLTGQRAFTVAGKVQAHGFQGALFTGGKVVSALHSSQNRELFGKDQQDFKWLFLGEEMEGACQIPVVAYLKVDKHLLAILDVRGYSE